MNFDAGLTREQIATLHRHYPNCRAVRMVSLGRDYSSDGPVKGDVLAVRDVDAEGLSGWSILDSAGNLVTTTEGNSGERSGEQDAERQD